MSRIGWTQPLCGTCFAAVEVGRGNIPRDPAQLTDGTTEPCMICATPTAIYTRIDPQIAEHFEHAKVRED